MDDEATLARAAPSCQAKKRPLTASRYPANVFPRGATRAYAAWLRQPRLYPEASVFDLRGALVRGPDDGFYRIEAGGFVHPEYLELVPGVGRWDRGQAWRVPANLVPTPNARPIDVPCCPRSGLVLRGYQVEAVRFALAAGPGCVIGLDVGLGKQQPVDTRVNTPSGWRAIGDLRPGDFVFGSDGRATHVTGVFPQGIKPSYRVRFSDGSTVEAGPDHLWHVAYRTRGQPPYTWRTVILTTLDLLQRPTIASADGRGTKRLRSTRLYLPMLARPLQYPAQRLPIQPYLLGALIANGGLTHGSPCLVTGTRDWPDVLAQLEQRSCSPSSIRVYGTATHATFSGLLPALRELRLTVHSREKRIPRRYLETREKDRVDLLHGLMDGDGSISLTQCRVIYHTISPGLADDVRELVEGLGGIASVRAYDRSREGKPTDLQVRVRLPEGYPPFLLPRKAARYTPASHAPPVRTVESVEYVRRVESVCIAVDASDQLYATEHNILTHNTVVALMVHHVTPAPAPAPAPAPFLVVGPLIAAGAWVGDEADPAVHFGLRVVALRSRNPQKFTEKHLDELRAADGFFINHEVLPDWQMQLQGFGCRTVIVDESHLLRSGKTDGAKAFRALVRATSVRTRIALTATPVVNKVADLWSQLDFAQPGGWGFWTDFVVRYQNAHATEYTRYALGDETNVEELRARLSRVLLRRSRFDVRKELPAFERQLAPLNAADLDARLVGRYRDLEEDFRTNAEAPSFAGLALQQITAMAGVLAEAKRPFAAAEAVNLAHATGAVVVFTWYKETASFVAAALRDAGIVTYGPIDSDTTKAKRDKAADAFKRDAIAARAPVAFVATIGCAGMSMNQLSAAPCALCCELYWVPATLLQMEGRIHREGQRAANCFVRYLYVRGTVDELMLRHLQRKARAIERVADDAEALSLCEALGGAAEKANFNALVEALLQGADDAGENK